MGGRGDKGKGRRRESNQTVSGKPLLFHNGSDPTFNSYSEKQQVKERSNVDKAVIVLPNI